MIATVPLAALVGGGGLGVIINNGFALQRYGEVLAGGLLVAVLCLVAEGVLAGGATAADARADPRQGRRAARVGRLIGSRSDHDQHRREPRPVARVGASGSNGRWPGLRHRPAPDEESPHARPTYRPDRPCPRSDDARRGLRLARVVLGRHRTRGHEHDVQRQRLGRGVRAASRATPLVVLTDDKHLQQVDNIVPAVNAAAAGENPEIIGVLDSVSAVLDTPTLVGLNKSVDVDRRTSSRGRPGVRHRAGPGQAEQRRATA